MVLAVLQVVGLRGPSASMLQVARGVEHFAPELLQLLLFLDFAALRLQGPIQRIHLLRVSGLVVSCPALRIQVGNPLPLLP